MNKIDPSLTNKELRPGSKEAIEKGCICPIQDNHYGNGAYITPDNEIVFWFNKDCPLHGKAKDLDPQTPLFKLI